MRRRDFTKLFITTRIMFAQENSADELDQRFTIMVRPTPDGSQDQKVGSFSNDAWAGLWYELGVADQDWQDWNEKTQSAEVYTYVPIVPDLPELSMLAVIEEGVVHFKAEAVRSETTRLLKRLHRSDTRLLVQSMLLAAEIALTRPGAEIIVHPFG